MKLSGGQKKYSILEIKKLFSDNDCELMQDYYKTVRDPVKYRCSCGNISRISIDNFKKGRRCAVCGAQKRVRNTRLFYKKVSTIFREAGCELLTRKYFNNQQSLKYKCLCGGIGYSTIVAFQNGGRCRNCFAKRYSGKNHPNYNPSLDDSYREKRRITKEYDRWRKKIYKRDNYTCQACGYKGKNIVAHHLYSYSEYDSWKYKTWNGITMCKTCHNKLHNMFSGIMVTPEMYLEFQEAA